MKSIPVAAKIIFNIILFVIYSIVWIFLWSFLYGLMLTILKKPVVWSYDPIHTKIAVISVLSILLITGLFRKYFYFPIFLKKEIKIKQTKKSYTKKTKQNKEEENTKIEDESDEKMKIYIDKEIK